MSVQAKVEPTAGATRTCPTLQPTPDDAETWKGIDQIPTGRESAESEQNKAAASSAESPAKTGVSTRKGPDTTPENREAVLTTPSLSNEPVGAAQPQSHPTAVELVESARRFKFVRSPVAEAERLLRKEPE